MSGAAGIWIGFLLGLAGIVTLGVAVAWIVGDLGRARTRRRGERMRDRINGRR